MGQPAAVLGDMVVCPLQTPTPGGPVPHVGAPLMPMGPPPTVLAMGKPIATMGGVQNLCTTPAGPLPNPFPAPGSPKVLVGGKPALRVGDSGAHPGSKITGPGAATVLIG
jgi:uncharacterized Zn-binding protein involved in type VI secretion